MMSTSVSIFEPVSSPNARLHFEVRLSAGDEPVVGTELKVRLEGSGSLAPSFDSKQIVRETDDSGRSLVVWYRRGIWDRDVKATLVVEAEQPEGTTLEIRALGPDEISQDTWISWAPRKLKLR